MLGHAYNPRMLQALADTVSNAVLERATLLVNHVLASEPVAQQRLREHAGRCIRLRYVDWPSLLPPLPAMAFRVTPAGLVEWCGPNPPEEADLTLSIDASNPALLAARVLVGDRPRVDVAGDGGFASDVNWLIDNLRWDIEDDLARVVGAAPARELARLARIAAAALRGSARTLADLAERARGNGPAR